MGFWETIAEAFETTKDAGASAIGAAVDIAQAVDDEASKKIPLYGELSDFQARNRKELLEVVGPVFTHAKRALATTAIVDGSWGDENDEAGDWWEPGSWRRAYNISEKTSFGQAFLYQGAKSRGDMGWAGLDDRATIRNLNLYGSGGERFSPKFSMLSGSADLVFSWFADPGVIAGKGATAARNFGKVVKRGDHEAIEAGVDLSRRQRKLVSNVDQVVDATRGMRPSELMQLKPFRESSQGGTMTYLLGRANKEADEATRDQAVREILNVGLGNRGAMERLSTLSASTKADIDNMVEDLGERVTSPDSRPLRQEEIDAVVGEIKARRKYLDELTSLGSLRGALGNRVPTLGANDYGRLNRLRRDFTVQDGIASKPIRLMHWAGGYRRPGG